MTGYIQKFVSSQVSRCCVKEYWRVRQGLEGLEKVCTEFEAELRRNRALAEKLKGETAKGLRDADMAQRTHDTPPGMQYDNVEPTAFFMALADEFERKIVEVKAQIDVAQGYLRHVLNPTPLTAEGEWW